MQKATRVKPLPMKIGIAGPYSAPTPDGRQQNLDRLNQTAAHILSLGHIPLIGINAALPAVQFLPEAERYEAIMKISLAVIDACDALLLIAESPGANRERDLVLAKGLPVYTDVAAIAPMQVST
jgi:hypothetical protein